MTILNPESVASATTGLDISEIFQEIKNCQKSKVNIGEVWVNSTNLGTWMFYVNILPNGQLYQAGPVAEVINKLRG